MYGLILLYNMKTIIDIFSSGNVNLSPLKKLIKLYLSDKVNEESIKFEWVSEKEPLGLIVKIDIPSCNPMFFNFLHKICWILRSKLDKYVIIYTDNKYGEPTTIYINIFDNVKASITFDNISYEVYSRDG